MEISTHFSAGRREGNSKNSVRDRIQPGSRTQVLLVGFAAKEGLMHEVCIEPENGALIVDDEVTSRATVLAVKILG